ncbi:DUF2569 domain-containing protein [Clostridium omnivorum]|uniref:DUF2569 domain-containing protein n=1 Tax=Clostridium omnivorum TaxID=1604902 RepID=A0ABQ5N404_9CLOT|nr:DUF2569 domain-containing protein [Clostridium sp. E14]GLC29910.1 hypothetical protein bsdE14_13200 [Clostridium sp. E14]
MNQLKRNNVQNLEIEGIGGWLILLAFGIVGSPIVYLLTFISTFIKVFINTNFTIIYAANNTLAMAIIFELIGCLILFAFSSYNLFLFFKKKNKFPKYMIIYFISNLCFQIITLLLSSLLNIEDNNNIAMSFLISGIWSLYLTKSARVKNTFKN